MSYGYGPREQSDEFEQDDPESSSLGDPQSVHLLVQEAGQDASASSGALKNEFEQFLHKVVAVTLHLYRQPYSC